MPKAKLFASLKQLAGTGTIEFPAATVGELLDAAVRAYGEEFERQLPHCTVLVNGVGVSQSDGLGTPIAETDEIAILPPVGGGS